MDIPKPKYKIGDTVVLLLEGGEQAYAFRIETANYKGKEWVYGRINPPREIGIKESDILYNL